MCVCSTTVRAGGGYCSRHFTRGRLSRLHCACLQFWEERASLDRNNFANVYFVCVICHVSSVAWWLGFASVDYRKLRRRCRPPLKLWFTTHCIMVEGPFSLNKIAELTFEDYTEGSSLDQDFRCFLFYFWCLFTLCKTVCPISHQ